MPSADPTNSLWVRAGEFRPGPSLAAAVCIRRPDAEDIGTPVMRRVAEESGTAGASPWRGVSGTDELVSPMYDGVAAVRHRRECRN
ncbi:hypothetical protein ACWCPQ_27765 [Nocardia sp. NPDC001965]